MKTLLLVFLFFSATQLKCEKDNDETFEGLEESDRSGYAAEDILATKVIADWEQFTFKSDSTINMACKKITIALDKLDDMKIPKRFRFEAAIFTAEGRLERLEEMHVNAKHYDISNLTLDNNTLRKIDRYKKEFNKQKLKLDRSLDELEKY